MKKGVAKKATKSVKKASKGGKPSVKKGAKKKVSKTRRTDQTQPEPAPPVESRTFICSLPTAAPLTGKSNGNADISLEGGKIRIDVGAGKKVNDFGYIVGDLGGVTTNNFIVVDGGKQIGYLQPSFLSSRELTKSQIIDILEDLVVTVLVKKKVR
jgi:hypothetical protein